MLDPDRGGQKIMPDTYDQKAVYEACATVAAALPDAEREIFADLLTRVLPSAGRAQPAVAPTCGYGAHRWLHDAGWSR